MYGKGKTSKETMLNEVNTSKKCLRDKMSKCQERQGREHQTVASMMLTNRDAGCNEEMSINIAVKILNGKPWATSLFPSDDKVYCGQTNHSRPK